VTKLKVTKRKQRATTASIAVTSAPTLTASGTTLTWTAIPGVSQYELATIRTVGTSKTTTYSTVTGTSYTPTAYPGETVYYGVRTYVSGSTWSAQVPITWPNTMAPTVTLSGTTLSWTPMTGVSTYEVATVTATTTTYQTVTGTTFTPPAAPGQTIRYGVRNYVGGSQWSSQVSITWPNTITSTLTLSGTTLSWTAMSGVSTYEIATISNPSTTRNTTYQTVTGTSFTPPAVPGQTVDYSVRSYLAGSAWAK
jgi:large repetitive protein